MKIYMKQKVFSIVDRYKMFDANQNMLYYTKGKFWSMRGVMELYDKNDQILFTFKHKLWTFLPSVMVYNHQTGEEMIVKRHFTMLKPKLTIKTNQDTYTVNGSYWQYSFDIKRNDVTVATVRKKILTWADTYEIDIIDDQHLIILALAIGIDTIIHNDRYNG